MKCESIQPDLLDYSKGLLSCSERARIKGHIEHCGECAALLAQEAAFDRRLAVLSEETPANDVWALVRIRTRPRRFRPLAVFEMVTGTRVRRVAALTATMAAVIGAFFVYNWPVEPPPKPPVDTHATVVAVSDEPLAQHTDAMFYVIEKM